MKLDWMMLANHAEDVNGLLYINGGTWDTVNVVEPLQGGPPGAVAVLMGTLCARVLFHPTETDREHSLAVTLIDEDGNEVQKIDGRIGLVRAQGLPTGWDQGANIVIPVSGTPLPKFGVFLYSIMVNGQHLGDRPFRALKLYSE